MNKNFEYLGSGGTDMYNAYDEYKVYNQNGFNNALYDFYGLDLDDKDAGIVRIPKHSQYNSIVKRQGKNNTEEIVYDSMYSEKANIRSEVQIYPTKYPTKIRIYRYHTFESGRLYMDIIGPHKIKEFKWTIEVL